MKSARIIMAVFTGTGNTLLMARVLADALRRAGKDVTLAPMERPGAFSLPEDAALGLAVPLACFSTYPTAWRFIDGLPEGRGREAFFLATMGGVGGGMEGPIRRVAEGKGYAPIGSKIVAMPSNYGNKTIPAEKNERLMEAAAKAVERYASQLLEGRAEWGRGKPLLSPFFAWLAHGNKPWRTFYRMFPLTVNRELCTGCGLCASVCPEGNIGMDAEAGKAAIGGRCESCQRCIAFCPAGAIFVPGKPAERYRGVEASDILSLLKE